MSPASDPVQPPEGPGDPSPRAFEALLAFWAEAGVSVSAVEQPVDRLAAQPMRPKPQEVATARIPGPASAPAPGPVPASAPQPNARHDQAAAREMAGSAADLAALAQAIAAFEGCALRHAGASRPVVWRGDPATADILVIGEAPTAADENAGQPFQGAEGRLLDRMLAAANVGPRTLLINTVFWRTPGGAAPGAADQAACRVFLERAAALLKPKAVLVVGAAAARGVLATAEPILKLRGSWATWVGEHEPLHLPTLATFSPAFLLAQPLAKKRAWADLLTLAERVDPRNGGP